MPQENRFEPPDSMDLATIIGLLGAFGFVIWAILLHGSLGMYYDITAVMIVFGGSTFAVLMKFSMTQSSVR